MAELTERVVVGGDNLTVPLLVFRRHGRPVPGLVEAIYSGNPGLAELGPFLPVGTVVNMPPVLSDPAPGGASQTPALAPITLW